MVPEAQMDEWAKMSEGSSLMDGPRRVMARQRVSVILAGVRG